jgi:hypothetical protein
VVDPASQSAGSGGLSGAVRKLAFRFPGGLTMEAMWPLVDRTNRERPPSSRVLR